VVGRKGLVELAKGPVQDPGLGAERALAGRPQGVMWLAQRRNSPRRPCPARPPGTPSCGLPGNYGRPVGCCQKHPDRPV